MPSLTIPAIVIQQCAYRDNDRMLTLLSPDLGRVDALSRGCRRPKSPLLTASELFATGEFVLYEKNGRYTLTAASVHESFYPLRLDYALLEQAVFLLKLCQTAAHIGDPAAELFSLVVRALHYLSYRQTTLDGPMTAFLLCYAALMGYQPELNYCVKCGKTRPKNASAWFDAEDGGIVCTACGGASKAPLSVQSLNWLKHVQEYGFESFMALSSDDAPYHLMRSYVLTKLERHSL